MAFSPTDLSGLVAWWDSDDAASFTFHSGTLVSQWADRSGGGLHMAQASSGSAPSRNVTSPTGKTAVRFSGRYLETALDSGGYVTGATMTVALVVRRDADTSATAGRIIVGHAQSLPDYDSTGFLIFDSDTGCPGMYRDPGGQVGSSPSMAVGDWGVVIGVFDGTDFTFHVNGSQTGTGAQSASFHIDKFLMGRNNSGGEFGDNSIGEVAIYDRALDSTERSDVADYLTAKWLSAGTPSTAASLGVTIGVSATAVKRAAVSAPLAIGLAAGSSRGPKTAATTASLDVDIALDAAAVMHAVTAATLGVALDLDAVAGKLAHTAAELGVALTVDAAAAKVAAAAMSLGVTIGIDGTAVKSAATAAVVDLAVTLVASPVKRAQVAAAFGIDLGIAATSAAVEPGHVAAALSIALACTTAAVKRAAASVSLGIDVGVTGAAVKHTASATALDVALDVGATAHTVGPVTTTATFGIAVAIGATAVKRVASVSTLALIVALAASSRDTAGRILGLTITGREPGPFTASESSAIAASEQVLVGREP